MGSVKERRWRVLVVDDEVLIAMNLRLVLKEMGYEVPAMAHSAGEAILCTREFQPDLILMDINLKGGRDGISAAEEIRERFGTPILFLTAYSDAAHRERANATQPVGYLSKPMTDHDLKVAVAGVIEKLTLDDSPPSE